MPWILTRISITNSFSNIDIFIITPWHEQGIKEDELFERVRALTDEYKDAEKRAEFGERTVEKLELTVDDLQESLYYEKKSYNEMSLKLDQTLNDIMAIHRMDQPSISGIEVEESD